MIANQTGRADWAACYSRYLSLLILRDADAAFGMLAGAEYKRDMAIQQAETRCASRQEVMAQRDVKAACRALCAAEEQHHQKYGYPLESAAISTVMAPAPNLTAVEVKLELIRRFELDKSRGLPCTAMEIIEADVAGISASPCIMTNGLAAAIDPAAAQVQHTNAHADTVTSQIEGIVTPAIFPLPRFDSQLALLIDAWVREWRACKADVHLTPEGVSLSQTMYFRGDVFESLAEDDGYPEHLRLQNRDELTGARRMLHRLLVGNPNAIGAIAHHLAAEARAAS